MQETHSFCEALRASLNRTFGVSPPMAAAVGPPPQNCSWVNKCQKPLPHPTPNPTQAKGEPSSPPYLVHTPRWVAGGGPQLGMDGKDLKNLGHPFLLLLAVVGHLSQHHLQKWENQGEGWCGQGRSICESKKQTNSASGPGPELGCCSVHPQGEWAGRQPEALSDTLKPAASQERQETAVQF